MTVVSIGKLSVNYNDIDKRFIRAVIMVELTGVEPATSSLRTTRSPN